MNYTYVDYFKYKYKNKVKKIYIKSFPRNERFPFGILKYCYKGKNVLFNIVLGCTYDKIDIQKIINVTGLVTTQHPIKTSR